MEIKFSALEWDSTFFGYSCGKLDSQNKILSNENILKIFTDTPELVFLTIVSDMAPTLSGISYQEIKVLYHKAISSTEEVILPNENIKKIEHLDRVNELYYLALQAGHESRYKNDQMMKNFEFEKLYFEWVFKSIKGEFDDNVFVYENKGRFAGLMTLKKRNEDMVIGLIAADQKLQGLGIGTEFVKFAELEAKKSNCKNLLVSTQKTNSIACSFYEKNSFKVLIETSVSHIWRPRWHQKYR